MNKKTIVISISTLLLWEVLVFIIASVFISKVSDAVLTNVFTAFTITYMFVLPVIIAFVLKRVHAQSTVSPSEIAAVLVGALIIRGVLNYPRLNPIELVTANTVFGIFVPAIVLTAVLVAASKLLKTPESH